MIAAKLSSCKPGECDGNGRDERSRRTAAARHRLLLLVQSVKVLELQVKSCLGSQQLGLQLLQLLTLLLGVNRRLARVTGVLHVVAHGVLEGRTGQQLVECGFLSWLGELALHGVKLGGDLCGDSRYADFNSIRGAVGRRR